MKKLFFTLLTLCLCGATWAYDFVVDDIYYNILTDVDGNQVEVTYTGDTQPGQWSNNNAYTGQITIPASVTNEGTTYDVTSIGEYAFAYSSVESVSIPSSVITIGDKAFQGGDYTGGQSSLVSVTFESDDSETESLISIGSYAFGNCTYLTEIILPSTLTSIGDNVFHGCSALTVIAIPDGVTSIETYAFQGCSALAAITLPSALTSIAEFAFYDCSSLTEIIIPAGVKTYGQAAFWNCTNLTTVVLLDTDPSDVEFGGEAGSSTGGSRDVFENETGMTIYVPTGTAPAYLASVWESEIETDGDYWNFNPISILSDSNDSGNVYYATYCTDAVGEFGSDVAPCIVTDVENGVVTYSSISGYIPAETGLLLVASNYDALNSGDNENSRDTYYYHPYGVTEATAISGNMLYGSSTQAITTVGPNDETEGYLFYELALALAEDGVTEEAGTIGFYWGAQDGGQFTSAAGKAYLAVPVSDGSSPASLHFNKNDNDTTGISAVENASEKAVSGIYTIQGVRVSNMNQSGLYIVDGKKVLVK